MLNAQTVFTLINPQNENLAFQLFSFEDDSSFNQIQRYNYYTVVWVTAGTGKLKTQFSEYTFSANTMFTFSLYQPFMITGEGRIEGIVLNFHPDFFCIYKHHKEVACNGILFNNIYEPPMIAVDENSAATFNMLMAQLKAEMQNTALAQYELMVSYLKIFLITAARLKTEQRPEEKQADVKEPFILQNLKDAIEEHFKKKHSASEYADMLNISAKALGRLTKAYFQKTLTDMIAERIVIEAKLELYLTNKPVKEIAFELGYADEYYFSRFFKTNASVSPQLYRDTVGFGKAMAD
ncbi:AraC family transcriptional regulator [Mucilaginibacter sp. X4EP1]|uniref:AraC family transcriptional regulator n=1 Tax=Mucilaginibacter sp. X4EP1 TaxID=2723092 RepID=UPI0021676BA7|nr:AraC family transcriptional regulator [Mucilaginibacter sp. X4EP1]MCS3812539.1 AraC-like DNA-binding protein [Mucilaginibacter sp. X4EP1]